MIYLRKTDHQLATHISFLSRSTNRNATLPIITTTRKMVQAITKLRCLGVIPGPAFFHPFVDSASNPNKHMTPNATQLLEAVSQKAVERT